jgi:hypothetical protein
MFDNAARLVIDPQKESAMRSVRRLVLVVSACCVVLAWAVTAGLAASPQRVSRAASLCTVAKGVAQSLEKAPATASLSTAQGQALFKHNIGRILAAKGALIGAAPSSLKTDMRQAIGVFALFKTDLTAVHFNFAALLKRPAMLHHLETAITKSEPAFNKLHTYFTKTCHY